MRKLILVIAFALFLAACGGSAEPTAGTAVTAATAASGDADNEPTATSAPQADSGDKASTEVMESTAAPTPSFDGPPAPDFELALSDGSTFRLSDEQKPVYVVFWAEW
ncbi:MAG: hypothetical protein GY953_33165 [bacterium]|nr:hypothetical protein [bacterium]